MNFRSILSTLVLAFFAAALWACGSSQAESETAASESGEGASSDSELTDEPNPEPAESLPEAPETEGMVSGFFVADDILPTDFFYIYEDQAAEGNSLCFSANGPMLGEFPVEITGDEVVLHTRTTAEVRAANPACNEVYNPKGPSDGVLPTSAPGKLTCTRTGWDLTCMADRGIRGEIVLTNVMGKIDPEELLRLQTSFEPNMTVEGLLVVDPAESETEFVLKDTGLTQAEGKERYELEGKRHIPVSGRLGSLMKALTHDAVVSFEPPLEESSG